MATITDFEDWLEEAIDGIDYSNVYNLYHTILDEADYGGFQITKRNGMWFVKSWDCEDTLMIASEKARDTLLSIIEDKYCEDMDIEGYYAFHSAMDKDD